MLTVHSACRPIAQPCMLLQVLPGAPTGVSTTTASHTGSHQPAAAKTQLPAPRPHPTPPSMSGAEDALTCNVSRPLLTHASRLQRGWLDMEATAPTACQVAQSCDAGRVAGWARHADSRQ